MFRYITLTLLSICYFSIAHAQQNIEVRLENSQQQGIAYATISVVSALDTTQKLSTLTDDSAKAIFEQLASGNYILKANALGYKDVEKGIAVNESSRSFVLTMEATASVIDGVVIKSERPLMRQEDDKTIIDPESLAEASTNGYEVLEKTPGIFLDQDGNIYLSSTTPATVFINGREMKMSRSDIAGMLRSLPPNSIEKIELLRTPSAKYDATASGGIVNVVLKKGMKIGLNGTLNMGVQQGFYGNQTAGISLNNNNGNTSMYVNANVALNKNYDIVNTDRILTGDTLLSQQARTVTPEQVAYLGYGINHDFNDKWNISYDGRLSYTTGKPVTVNQNNFLSDAATSLGSSVARLNNNNKSFLVNQDMAFKYKIDSLGSEWTSNINYVFNQSNIKQDFNTESIIPYGGGGEVKAPQHYIALQSDLTKKLAHRITVEAGIKASYLSFNNDANYYLELNGNRSNDASRTSTYQYTENLNSGYIQASKGLGSFLLKAGLRAENTNMEGRQRVPGDTSFNINRTDLFPYVYLSRKLMAIAGYELRSYLVYRRTITRPNYGQLNPFPKYIDQFLSEVGNPSLQPQFTSNYEANISIGERPLFAVGFNDTRDMFTNVYYQDENNTALAYRTYDNVGRNKEFYLRGFAAIPPGGRYFFVIGGQYNHNIYEGLYEGQPLNFKGDNWMFFTYHQFKIDKLSQLTLNGFMRLKGPLQFYELGTFGALNLNVNRKFFDKKLTVTLSLSDIFFTSNNEFTLNQASVRAMGYREKDSRRVGINLRYNFGFHGREEHKDMFENMAPPAPAQQ